MVDGVMYLLDTNIWLELLLDQEKAGEVRTFIEQINENFYLTDFSLFSIGIILFRLKKEMVLQDFIEDVLINARIQILRLEIRDFQRLIEIRNQYSLDFDDSYQYTVAEKYQLTLISYDRDFDSTDRGRASPGEVVAKRRMNE